MCDVKMKTYSELGLEITKLSAEAEQLRTIIDHESADSAAVIIERVTLRSELEAERGKVAMLREGVRFPSQQSRKRGRLAMTRLSLSLKPCAVRGSLAKLIGSRRTVKVIGHKTRLL